MQVPAIGRDMVEPGRRETNGDGMNHWMQRLSQHVTDWQRQHPHEQLVVLLDIEPLINKKRLVLPFLRVLRWFQIQPNGAAGIIAGPEHDRADLLKWINKVGKSTRFSLEKASLFVGERATEGARPLEQTAWFRHFQQPGRTVISTIAVQAGTLETEAVLRDGNPVLSVRVGITAHEFARKRYQNKTYRQRFSLRNLIDENAIPDSIIPCWHGINDPQNLRQFFNSDYPWGEVDVRIEPDKNRLITRHDSFLFNRLREAERLQNLENVLKEFKRHRKNIKIDFKRGWGVVDKVVELLRKYGFRDEMLWFHGSVRVLRINGYRKLARSYPDALIQATIDRFVLFIAGMPAVGKFILDRLAGLGVNQFLLSWRSRFKTGILEKLDRWGYRVNFYKISDLEDFLQAVLFLPASITADFNFPEWDYYGRGSGQNMKWHEFPEKQQSV